MPEKYEYKVLTLQDVEQELYALMQAAGVAEPIPGQLGKLRIKDLEQAKSENSMPVFLNHLGKDGWELATINQAQLYVFQRQLGGRKVSWEYKVLTSTDVDALVFAMLTAQKAAEPVEGEQGKFRVLDVEKAKSQNIMPQVLASYAKDRWVLVATSQSGLYIFRRKGEGKMVFDTVAAQPAN